MNWRTLPGEDQLKLPWFPAVSLKMSSTQLKRKPGSITLKKKPTTQVSRKSEQGKKTQKKPSDLIYHNMQRHLNTNTFRKQLFPFQLNISTINTILFYSQTTSLKDLQSGSISKSLAENQFWKAILCYMRKVRNLVKMLMKFKFLMTGTIQQFLLISISH